MPPVLAGQLDRVRATLATLTFAQRVTLGVLLVGLALGGFVFVRWVTTPAYEPLFSNLSSTDASAIVDELNAQGVAYQLPDGSGTIMVPKGEVYSLRLTMAGLGLPAGSDTGYSLLDEQGITTSEFQQQTSYQRALEGELASTLKALNGVTAATVHIAMPKNEVFVTDTSEPKASVLLQLRPGTRLSGEQVQSVTHLVASSVDGMSPERVTVSDQTGALLSAQGAAGAGSQAQADDTAAFEQRLAANAQSMLDRALGTGNAVVQVAATLDFDQSSSTAQTYSYPNELPALAESRTTEDYTGAGAGAAGVLGTDGTTTTTGEGTYTKEAVTANNPVDTTTTTTVATPGSVQRLTVSVLLNTAGGAAIAPGTVQDLVSNAVALDPGRGDAITVASMVFDTTAADAAAADLAAAEAAAASERTWSMVRTGLVVAGLLLLVALVWWRNRKRQAELAEEDYEPLELETGAELDPLVVTSTRDARLDLSTAGAIEALERQRLRGEITTMIEQQPDAVASTLRGWLAESRT